MNNPEMVGDVLHSFYYTGNAAVLLHTPANGIHIVFSEHMERLPYLVAEIREFLLKEYRRIKTDQNKWALMGPLLTIEVTFDKVGLTEHGLKRMADYVAQRVPFQLAPPQPLRFITLPQPVTVLETEPVSEVVTRPGMIRPFRIIG